MGRLKAASRSERRTDPRNKVRKVGRIVVDAPPRIVACIILDMSSTGALLLVHDKVPETFQLFYAATKTLRDVTVVRRQRETLGVRFDGEPVVLKGSDPRLTELLA